jgi:hypothetical protein
LGYYLCDIHDLEYGKMHCVNWKLGET